MEHCYYLRNFFIVCYSEDEMEKIEQELSGLFGLYGKIYLILVPYLKAIKIIKLIKRIFRKSIRLTGRVENRQTFNDVTVILFIL